MKKLGKLFLIFLEKSGKLITFYLRIRQNILAFKSEGNFLTILNKGF